MAKVLAAKPAIECVAIVGPIAAGEPPGLAEQRAKNVRDLLGAHGVSLTRLLTIGATAKVFGNGSRPAEPDPAQRQPSSCMTCIASRTCNACFLAELIREAASDATSAEARVRVVGLRRAKVLSGLAKISQPIFPDLLATTSNIAGRFLRIW